MGWVGVGVKGVVIAGHGAHVRVPMVGMPAGMQYIVDGTSRTQQQPLRPTGTNNPPTI